MEKQRSLEKQLYRAGLWLLPGVAVTVPLLWIWLEGRDLSLSFCPFWLFLGMYCPGCGGTRAVHALLHGRILMSLWYHPLVFYCVVLYLAFMLSWTAARLHLFGVRQGMRFRTGYLYFMLAIVCFNFVAKNVLKFCFGIMMI